MASSASELIWIKQLLVDIGIEAQNPMKIFCDNQTARHKTYKGGLSLHSIKSSSKRN
jgi:hypothetical protein